MVLFISHLFVVVVAHFVFYIKEKAKEISQFDYKSYKDEDLKRQFKLLSKLGYSALPADKFKELNNAINAMQANYAKIRICSYKDRTKCDLQLEPGTSSSFSV